MRKISIIKEPESLYESFYDLSLTELRMLDLCKGFTENINRRNGVPKGEFTKRYNLARCTAKIYDRTIEALSHKTFTLNNIEYPWFTEVTKHPECIGFTWGEKVREIYKNDKLYYFHYDILQKLEIKSSYRLYKLLCRNLRSKKISYTLEELKQKLSISKDDYVEFSNFRQKYLELAIKNIDKNIGVKIDVNYIRLGRAIHTLEFTLVRRASDKNAVLAPHSGDITAKAHSP